MAPPRTGMTWSHETRDSRKTVDRPNFPIRECYDFPVFPPLQVEEVFVGEARSKQPPLVRIDGKGRVSLGKAARHPYYLVQVCQDGTIVLTPARVVPDVCT